MEDLSGFCCQNLACPDHGKRGAGNLSVCAHYGPHQRRLLYCHTCKDRFSERKGSALFDVRLPEAKAIEVFKHLAEGCGVRATARLTGVNRTTALRLARLAGAHAKAVHDEKAAFSPSDRRSPV